MKPRLFSAAVVIATVAVVGAFVAGPAGATPPGGYGFDDTSHVIVGGGSDTTYYTMQQLTTDWAHSDFGTSGGCNNTTSVGPNINECVANANPETNDLGNWQHDTIAQANPVGSSTGIASLNGFNSAAYGGTVNGTPPNVDFARSSRGPKTTGGNCSGGNELTCDTFWGYGQDGIQIVVINSRVADAQSSTALTNHAITPIELYHIFNCDYAMWDQVASLGIAVGAPNDGPIVPWTVNTASGTFATFQTYIDGQSGVPAGWSPAAPTGTANTGTGPIDNYTNKVGCDRELAATGQFPQENDLKPLVNDPSTASLDQRAERQRPGELDHLGLLRRAVGAALPVAAGSHHEPGCWDAGHLRSGRRERQPAVHEQDPRQHVGDRSDAVPRHQEDRRGLPGERRGV